MAIVIPAILTDNKAILERQLKCIESASELVQIDICDGEFVSNKTFDPLTLKEVVTSARYDLHLMVKNPGQVVEQLYDLPNINRILFHVEPVQFPTAQIEHIKGYGHGAWIAVTPETMLEDVEGYVYQADGVLFLAVHPGKQGQALLPEVFEKIKQCKTKHPTVRVGIDGGVKKEHIAELKAMGVDEICVGSAVFAAPDPAAALKELQELAK
ncbi:MAG: ribulose-phosphate 3-epimerase [Candidatus Magasanikbacteria bacterium]|nr:ribulose-phosphate 3-epimerase [Candidatus Magasanikbacteria bacterium]